MKSIIAAAPRALLAATFSMPACAQTAGAQDSALLDPVLVVGRRNPDDPEVVRAARDDLTRTPGAVAVVSLESYRDRFAQGFPDSLRNVPGVIAQKRYGEESRLSIRGSGVSQSFHQRGVLFAQDGAPYTEADGSSDYEAIDQLTARHIEVYKGANALRFGGAQLGGAINLVTPTGRTAPAAATIQAEAGSWGLRRLHTQLAGVAGPWDGFAAVTAMEADGWRQQTDQSQGRMTASLGRSLGPDRELRLVLQALDVRQAVVSGVTLEDALTRPRLAPPANVANGTARDQVQKRAALQGRWRLGEASLVEGAVWASVKSLHHPVFQIIEQDSRSIVGFVRGRWDGRAGRFRADALYGLHWRQGDLDGERFVNVAGAPGARTASSRQKASGRDIFIEARVFLNERLAVVGGGSFGRATRDYRDHLMPANSASATYQWLSPRVGLLWESDSGNQIFGNLTRSVEPPTYAALVQPPLAGFVPLDPQTAWTAELGARGRGGGLAWDIAYYRSAIDGELLNFITGPDIPAQTFNAGRTLHQGIEAGLDWRPPVRIADGSVTLRQTWTWSDFRFKGDSAWGDKALPVIPRHQYRAELTWRHASGIAVTPSLEWRPGEVWVDYANTMRAQGYALFGLNMSAALRDNVTLYADLRNLTDERYVGDFAAVTDARIASTRVFFPGEGRSAFVGLRLSY